MRTSRDILRPLAALVVVVGAILLVANVAAYRTATTPSDATKAAQTPAHADDDHASVSARGDTDGDHDGYQKGDADSDGSTDGRKVVVVTETGAS